MEYLWYWVHLDLVHLTELSIYTVVDWYNVCRDVVVDCLSKRHKTGG